MDLRLTDEIVDALDRLSGAIALGAPLDDDLLLLRARCADRLAATRLLDALLVLSPRLAELDATRRAEQLLAGLTDLLHGRHCDIDELLR
jgi:hypothetical protein